MCLDASNLIHLTLFDALTKSFWRSWLNRFPSNSHPKTLLGYCAYDLLKVLGEIHLIDPTLIALPGCWRPIYGTSEGPCVLASDVRGLFWAFDEKIFIPGKLRLQVTWKIWNKQSSLEFSILLQIACHEAIILLLMVRPPWHPHPKSSSANFISHRSSS